jgi:ubiquinone/menaquinone biosynthesis C-methylase UbiE
MEPETNEEYRTRDYWEKRYANETRPVYEWFMDYARIKPLILPYINESSRIIDLGCGNSELAVSLYNDNFQNVIGIDFSDTVIQKAQERYPHVEWLVQDMRKMTLVHDSSIDVIIDKGGLDALFAENSNPWEPSEAVIQDVTDTINEVARILKPNGVFISISLGQPHFRKHHYQTVNPNLVMSECNDLGFYFCYIMTKSFKS